MVEDLINARKHSGLTQKQIAERFGVTEKTIHNWESGKPIPSSKLPMVMQFIKSQLYESPVKQRLIQFIKFKNMGQQKFETICGLSNGYVNNITRGIGAEKLADISRQFPELNTDWV